MSDLPRFDPHDFDPDLGLDFGLVALVCIIIGTALVITGLVSL